MRTILAVCTICVALFNQNIHAQSYQIIDLGTLGGSYSQAEAMNNSGQVVGNSPTVEETAHGFLYLNGFMHDLGTLGGTYGDATSINSNGVVAGYAQLSGDAISHAYIYTNHLLIDIDTLNTGRASVSQGMNNKGQVVGYLYEANGNYNAFLYSGGAMQDLGNFGGLSCFAVAINDAGLIAGTFTDSGGTTHPSILNANGTLTDLGSLGGSGFVRGMNNSGQIVGASGGHAFVYTNGAMVDLGPGIAYAVNNSGQVVGTTESYTGNAILFSGSTQIDLNSLIPAGSGWALTTAAAINDQGQIAGYGISPSGQTHAFLLQPVSIPMKITGSSITMGVTVVGNPPITYQWSLKGHVVAGASVASLTITNGSQTGTYKVTATDASAKSVQQSFNVNIMP
jgi:probable HAF family extracellular repeat protein